MVSQKIMSQILPQLQRHLHHSVNSAVAEALNNEHPDDMITHNRGVGITVAGDDVITKRWLKYYEQKSQGKNPEKPTAKSDQTAATAHAESVADGTLAKKLMNPNVIAAIPDVMAKGNHFKKIPPINIKM
jgi:hypothetical protein